MTAPQNEDARFFESIQVEITHRAFSDETKFTEATQAFDINEESLQVMAVAAQEASARMAPGCRCVVTMKGNGDATFPKREHFVSEGSRVRLDRAGHFPSAHVGESTHVTGFYVSKAEAAEASHEALAV